MEKDPRKLQEWLSNNRDAIMILATKIKELDSVRKGRFSEYPEESRRLAIQIMEEWIKEVWGIAWTDDFYQDLEDDSIVNYIDKVN